MIRVPHLGDSDVGVLLPHKVNVLVGQVLAHDESPAVRNRGLSSRINLFRNPSERFCSLKRVLKSGRNHVKKLFSILKTLS